MNTFSMKIPGSPLCSLSSHRGVHFGKSCHGDNLNILQASGLSHFDPAVAQVLKCIFVCHSIFFGYFDRLILGFVANYPPPPKFFSKKGSGQWGCFKFGFLSIVKSCHFNNRFYLKTSIIASMMTLGSWVNSVDWIQTWSSHLMITLPNNRLRETEVLFSNLAQYDLWGLGDRLTNSLISWILLHVITAVVQVWYLQEGREGLVMQVRVGWTQTKHF